MKNNKYSEHEREELMGEVKSLVQEVESLKRNLSLKLGAKEAVNSSESVFLKIAFHP